MAANALSKPIEGDLLAKANTFADDIQNVTREFGLMAIKDEPAIVQAIRLAQGIQKLRDVLTVQFVEFMFMPLMGSPLGFLTDMDREAKEKHYKAEVVRDVMVEALLRGFMPTGNEFNIISGRFYGAKNGVQRLVEEFHGLLSIEVEPGVPEMAPNSTALVPFRARWVLVGGEVCELFCEKTAERDGRIPVKVNSGMGPDALLGKAECKLYKRVLKRLNANAARVVGDDEEPGAAIPTTGTPALAEPKDDGKRMRITGKKNGEQQELVPPSDTNGNA